MFTTGLIVFRETLEAALFIGIMAAATRGLAGRSWWIVLGVLAGVAGAFGVAAMTSRISDAAGGTGQEWFNVVVLGLAFIMLTWHVIWSSTHGRELATQAKHVGANVKSGKNSMWAIAIAIAMIVLREGAETVLFVSGAAAGSDMPVTQVQMAANPTNVQNVTLPQEVDLSKSVAQPLPESIDLTKKTTEPLPAQLPQELDLTKNASTGAQPALLASEANSDDHLKTEMHPTAQVNVASNEADNAPESMSRKDVLVGGLVGLIAGAIVGLVMYFGLARIPIGRLFSVTNVFVVILAAGMMGQLGNKLVQAQILPSGADPIWDSSNIIGQDGAVGTLIHALVGYEAQPSLTHVIFFLSGLLLIVLAGRLAKVKTE